MGLAKSILTGFLSFMVFTTLPAAITGYLFLQQMDISNLGGNVGGTILGTILEESGFLEQIGDQLASTLPELQTICSIYPDQGLSDIFANMSEMGSGEELMGLILPCLDIPCSDIMTMDSSQLAQEMVNQMGDCDIQIPSEFLEGFNMTDYGGFDFGGFDLGGMLGQVEYFAGLAETWSVYLTIFGLICAVLLLIVSRDLAYFSRRMGMIFLITGISFIVLTFVLIAILPGIMSNMFAGMGETVTSIISPV